MTASEFEYDVCLSFAGEQRSYVERFATILGEHNIRVFYDRHEQADLWGKDLYEHLDDVYRKRARFCVIFISADYARNVWPNHERKSAQARAVEAASEYLLPARFDDTEIPGIRPTVGYIDLRVTGPEELAALTIRKLTGSIPATASAHSRIADQYVGTFPRISVDWLLDLDQPAGITDLGDGRVGFTAAAFTYLRNLPDHLDGHIDGTDTIWLAGDPYKLTRARLP